MSGSCVTTTSVIPLSRFSRWKMRHDLDAGARVERAGRLVRQDELRIVDQRARDGHALLLSAGELARLVIDAVRQAHRVQRRHARGRVARRRAMPV